MHPICCDDTSFKNKSNRPMYNILYINLESLVTNWFHYFDSFDWKSLKERETKKNNQTIFILFLSTEHLIFFAQVKTNKIQPGINFNYWFIYFTERENREANLPPMYFSPYKHWLNRPLFNRKWVRHTIPYSFIFCRPIRPGWLDVRDEYYYIHTHILIHNYASVCWQIIKMFCIARGM